MHQCLCGRDGREKLLCRRSPATSPCLLSPAQLVSIHLSQRDPLCSGSGSGSGSQAKRYSPVAHPCLQQMMGAAVALFPLLSLSLSRCMHAGRQASLATKSGSNEQTDAGTQLCNACTHATERQGRHVWTGGEQPDSRADRREPGRGRPPSWSASQRDMRWT